MGVVGFVPESAAGEPEFEVLRPRKVEIVGDVGEETAQVAGAFIQLEVNERPLKQVLDYLSNVSGVNIRVRKAKDERLLVTFKLENVTYRAILDFIVKKYGMLVDDSMLAQNIIFLDTPDRVSMQFNNADVRDVINTIAIQANANIVLGTDITGQVSMRLENVPWRDALNIVVKTLGYVVVEEANNTLRITTVDKISAQLEIRLFRLAYISPEGSKYTALLESDVVEKEDDQQQQERTLSLIDVLTKIKTPQGAITYEKRTNTVVIKDTKTALDDMERIITKIDIPPKQVHVAIKLIEVTDADMERLGVDWGPGIRFRVTPVQAWTSAFPFDVSNGLSRSLLGDLAVATGVRRAFSPDGTRRLATDVFQLGEAVREQGGDVQTSVGPIQLGSMGFQNMSALLELMRNKTSSRIIQAPQLVALDNEEATIQVGQVFRYAEEIIATTEGGGQVGGFREAAGSPIRLGFQLLVIAHVTGPENNVLMTIIPKTEELIQIDEFGGGQLQLPRTSQAIVVTKMMLRNGETGVIGGIRTEREDTAQNKVPIFGDIPIIGRLFKHRSRNTESRSLMVFVTPTVIDFFDRDAFKKDLEKLRRDLQTPYTTIGDVEVSSAP